jgi:glyoxylase-like metal-dependent hydrolase (beta-lactamase superfamily II)
VVRTALLAVVLAAAGCGSDEEASVADAAPSADAWPVALSCEDGSLPPVWTYGGPNCLSLAQVHVHRYDRDTWILRQSLCTAAEAPFMFVLFGEDKVLLEDTGAGDIAIRAYVDDIIDTWLAERGRDSIELVVVNSHGHPDHIAGNDQFDPASLVGYTVPDLTEYFSLDSWPDGVSSIDLGERVVDVLPTPGHQGADIALYDRSRRLLLAGDTVHAGRLTIADFPAYQTSIDRLVEFAADHEVCYLFGAHVEMSNTAGEDFAVDSYYHPDEHPLELALDNLTELQTALAAMAADPVEETHDEFVIVPL